MAKSLFSLADLSVSFLSSSAPLPSVCIKFIVANFAADIAVNDLISNDLISVSALPCVFGADCEVVTASVGLLAVTFLLALPCVSGEDCGVVAASVELLAVAFLLAPPCVSGEDCGVVAASVELLAVAFLLALVAF